MVNTLKKTIRKLRVSALDFKILISLLFAAAFFVSCQNEFLPVPSVPEGANALTIAAPSGLTASHGEKRKVTLTWNIVDNAVRYSVWSAPTPYDKFQLVNITPKVSETSPQNTCTLKSTEGATAWYYVTATDAYGVESDPSIMVMGTTLAKPYISSIIIDDCSSTVHWYMGNVSEDSYGKTLLYNVKCVDSNQQLVVSVPGTETSAVFEGLASNREYTFSVEAYLSSDQTNSETSVEITTSTSVRLYPDPPADFEVTQGSSSSEIEISFTLPNFVLIGTADGYEERDVYFQLYRRKKGESSWGTPVYSYMGFKENYPAYKAAPSNRRLLLGSEYLQGESFTITDSTISEKGVVYEYCMQSFADLENGKAITDETNSRTYAEGWLMPEPSVFNKNYTIIKNEDGSTVIGASVNFSAEWSNLSTTSKYALAVVRNHKLFDCDNNQTPDSTGSDSILGIFNSTSELNEYNESFDLSNDSSTETTKVRGYYTYSVHIVPRTSLSGLSSVEQIEAASIVHSETPPLTVTNSLYEITGVNIKDGFKNKFELTWNDDSDYTFSVSYIPIEKNGSAGIKSEPLTISSSNATLSDGKWKYSCSAESGDVRKFIIYANRNDETEPPANWTSESSFETLGTPAPNFDATKKSYTDILVTWPEVQKSAGYSVKFNGTAASDDGIVYDEDTKTYSYTFANVAVGSDGLLSAKNAGKSYEITIEAHSDVDSVSANVSAATMGPALLSAATIAGTFTDKIELTWNDIEGANSYLIQRERYDIEGNGSSRTMVCSSTEQILVNASTMALTFSGDSINANMMEISKSNGKWKFIDKDTQSDDTSGQLEKSQSMISWGVPYRYTVIPLLSGEDEFTLDSEGGDFGQIGDAVHYSDLKEISTFGSASGYGLNVKATKAESANTIVITWDEPFSTTNLTPVLYSRSTSTGTWAPETLGRGEKQKIFPIDATDTDVYEYMVQYFNGVDKRQFTKSYTNFINSTLDENGEKVASGYGFTLPPLKAENVRDDDGNEGYTEKVGWQFWDYSKRKRGPAEGDTYTVLSKNLNNSSAWFPVATITVGANNRIQGRAYGTEAVDAKAWYDCDFEPSPSNDWLKLTPLGIADEKTHNGLLKVQRDYKHYYKIVATRTFANSSGESTTISTENESNTYRRINHAEIVKAALLNIAYGFYIESEGATAELTSTGTLKYQGGKIIPGASGSANFGERDYLWGDAGKYAADVSFNAYSPSMLTPSGESVSFLSVSFSNVSTRTKGLVDAYLDKFRTENFTVNVSLTGSTLASYRGSFTMTCTGDSNLKVTMDGKDVVNASSSAERKKWFPIQIGSSVHCMKESEWWEVRK